MNVLRSSSGSGCLPPAPLNVDRPHDKPQSARRAISVQRFHWRFARSRSGFYWSSRSIRYVTERPLAAGHLRLFLCDRRVKQRDLPRVLSLLVTPEAEEIGFVRRPPLVEELHVLQHRDLPSFSACSASGPPTISMPFAHSSSEPRPARRRPAQDPVPIRPDPSRRSCASTRPGRRYTWHRSAEAAASAGGREPRSWQSRFRRAPPLHQHPCPVPFPRPRRP